MQKRRRTKEHIKANKIIKAELLLWKERILEVAVPRSRRRPFNQGGGRLQDEMNGRVDPDTRLTMYQMYYGEFNYPAGITSGEKNALRITINEQIPATMEILIGNINDYITRDYGNNKNSNRRKR